jgi:uncharacterized protein involved in outer membrane biogenesis
MRFKAPFFGILLAIAGFLLPSIMFVALLPSLINAEPVKKRLIEELRGWTGSDIHIAGPISIDNFFSLTVNLRDVEFTGFAGFVKFKSLRADEIVARIAWTNLLIGSFDFDKIKINGAIARLGPEGENDLEGALRTALRGPHKAPFSAFIIKDCVIKSETPDGSERTLTHVNNAAAEYRPSDGRISLSGALNWRGEQVYVDARTFAAPAGAEAGSIPLKLDIDGRLITASFKGQANFVDAWTASGALEVKTPDAAALFAWLGIKDGRAIAAPLEISGALDLTASQIGLQSAALSIAGHSAYGDFTISRAPDAAKIEGSLAFDTLDLRQSWALITAPRPVSPGERGFWMDALRGAALDLRLSAGEVRWDTLTMKDAALTLSGQDGVVSADLADLTLFGGSVIGHLQADLRQGPARLRARITGDNIEAAELLAAGAKGDWLDGRADINIEAEAAGNTAGEIFKTARGEAKIGFPEGGQMQLDLPQLVKSPTARGREGWDSASLAWTKFDSMRVHLSLKDASLRCEGFLLTSPEAQLRGTGEVDLGGQNLDLTLTVSPGATGADAGQTASDAPEANPGIGLSIKGPWAHPEIRLGERSGHEGGHRWLGAEAPVAPSPL